jgi:hypothetical protein
VYQPRKRHMQDSAMSTVARITRARSPSDKVAMDRSSFLRRMARYCPEGRSQPENLSLAYRNRTRREDSSNIFEPFSCRRADLRTWLRAVVARSRCRPTLGGRGVVSPVVRRGRVSLLESQGRIWRSRLRREPRQGRPRAISGMCRF